MTTDFIESPRFPDCVARGAEGGPGYNVKIVSLESGFEVRNNPWKYPRGEYNAMSGVKDISDIENILSLFHVAEGPTLGFRFWDHRDYKSCSVLDTPTMLDQVLVPDLVADPTGKTYDIIKTYVWGAHSKVRDITKPVAATVFVADNGVLQAAPADYTLDDTTGRLVFASVPTGPVTTGYEFDVPVRYTNPKLAISLQWAEVGSFPIDLIEIKIARS